ncbi:hypothetical protein BLNAU_22006 [Blattamonas nauphoetae]|uniref:Uncharacterized protein n=1 Tax=Blattamonas nauphoetae TaxID=2049346 RepID=A0ABQ9WUB6_9EUKA|nr:hypothetical protein BLNAU_22006 [Blattamonas nauphoetae]
MSQHYNHNHAHALFHVLAEFVTNQQPIRCPLFTPWRLYGREDKHVPFQQSGWDRRIGEGTRMVLLRDAKFPSDRSKSSNTLGGRGHQALEEETNTKKREHNR